MFNINEGTVIPTDFNTRLIQFTQNYGEREAGGLLAIRDGRIMEFFDLKGYHYKDEWAPNDESVAIINEVMSDWDSGLYDEVIFVHTHPPHPGLTSIFRYNGIDVRLISTPSINDIANYVVVRDNWFNGHDMKWLILSSPSLDDLNAGKIYMKLSEINPDFNVYLHSDKLLKVSYEGYSFIHPLDLELKGGYKTLYLSVSPEGNIIISETLPDGNFGDAIRLSYDQFLGLKTEYLLSQSKATINKVYLNEIGKDLGRVSLERNIERLDSLNTELQGSSLPQSSKDTYSAIIASIENTIQQQIDYNFGEDYWLSYITNIGDIELSLSLEVIEGISGISYIGQWNLDNGVLYDPDNGLYFDPQAQYVVEQVVAVADDGIEMEWGPWVTHSYTASVDGTVDLPDELSQPLNVAKTKYWGIIAGISFSFLQFLSPFLEKYGRETNNYLLYYLGYGIRLAGYAVAISYFASVGITIYTLANLGAIGTGLITELLLDLLINMAIGLIVGVFVSIVLILVITLIYGPYNPLKDICVKDNPWYDKDMLKMEYNAGYKDHWLKYVVYGLDNCVLESEGVEIYNLELRFSPTGSMYDDATLNDPELPGGYYCEPKAGRCFECYVLLSHPDIEVGDTYYVDVSIRDRFHDSKYIYFDDPQEVTICPEEYLGYFPVVIDPPGKCIICGDFNDEKYEIDENGDCVTGDLLCESACGASPECDNFKAPGGWWCEGPIFHYCDVYCHYQEPYCSSSCGGDEECNGRQPSETWCDKGVLQSCDKDCKHSGDNCLAVCGADTICHGRKQGSETSNYWQCDIDGSEDSSSPYQCWCDDNCGFVFDGCEEDFGAHSDCDELDPGALLPGDCYYGNEKTVDKCDMNCHKVDTDICDADCGANLECEGKTSGESWCYSNTKKYTCSACQLSEETCRTGAEDSDEGLNYITKGTCTKYKGCKEDESGTHCDEIPYIDNCGCYSIDPNDETAMIKCYSFNETKCEDDPDCFFGLKEWYKSGSTCEQEFFDCSELHHQEYICYDGACTLCEEINNYCTDQDHDGVKETMETCDSSCQCTYEVCSGPCCSDCYSVDLRRDGQIDIYDVVRVTSIYGSKEGDPNWNATKDLRRDGQIDIYDVIRVTGKYGVQC